jgi:hypothetical protein
VIASSWSRTNTAKAAALLSEAKSAEALPEVRRVEATHHDLAWVIQRAWSVFRLPRLQELVLLTIAEVQSLSPQEVLGRELPVPERADCDPVVEALRACCDELRDASGMAGADAERASHCRAVRRYIEQEPTAWSETFAEALGKYRRAASRALQSAFARAVS